jgi:aspartate/tyrosine/aromatic aminotransferase
MRFSDDGEISDRHSPLKVDLGVGVYRDLHGNTPVLECVRRAEQAVLAAQTTKSYVAAAGREEFNRAVEEMVLGPSMPPGATGEHDRADPRGAAAPCGWARS